MLGGRPPVGSLLGGRWLNFLFLAGDRPVVLGWAGDRRFFRFGLPFFFLQQTQDIVPINMPPDWLMQVKQLLHASCYLAPCT